MCRGPVLGGKKYLELEWFVPETGLRSRNGYEKSPVSQRYSPCKVKRKVPPLVIARLLNGTSSNPFDTSGRAKCGRIDRITPLQSVCAQSKDGESGMTLHFLPTRCLVFLG